MCDYFWIGFIDFILARNALVNFTSLFSLYDFENDDKIILKMNEWNSIEIDKTSLNDQTKYRLN